MTEGISPLGEPFTTFSIIPRLRKIADRAREIQNENPISIKDPDNDYAFGFAVGVESILRYICGDAPADPELQWFL